MSDGDLSRLRRLPLKAVSVFIPERRYPLHAMISSGGHSREVHQRYNWNGMERGTASFAVLQLTLGGNGMLGTTEGTRELDEGMLMIVDIPSQHRYYLPLESTMWEFVYLVVHGSELLRIISAIERREGNVMMLQENSKIPHVFYRILKFLFAEHSPTAFEVSAMAYELGMTVLADVCAQTPVRHTPRIELLKRKLRGDPSQRMSVSEMARFAGFSRSHFARLFKQREGISPLDFLKEVRLRRALKLLYSDTATVKEIAYFCGIPDVNYFCRFFRKHTGMSPGEYRRRSL